MLILTNRGQPLLRGSRMESPISLPVTAVVRAACIELRGASKGQVVAIP